MDVFSIYITVFFFVFLIFPSIFFCVKLLIWCHTEYCKRPEPANAARRNDGQRSTVFTITSDRLSDDQRNFPDYFWNVSPHTSRSRDGLYKDDKDLPTYDEVMQMEMRQQVIGVPATVVPMPATVAALPAAEVTPPIPANETATPTTTVTNTAPPVTTASV